MIEKSEQTSMNTALLKTIINLGEKSTKAYVILDNTFRVNYQNISYKQLTGFSLENTVHKHFSEMLYSDDRNSYFQFEQKMRTGEMFEMTLTFKKNKNQLFTGKVSSIPFQNHLNKTDFVLLLIEDVTELVIQQSFLRLEQTILQAINQSTRFEQKLEQICTEINSMLKPHCFATIASIDINQLSLYSDRQLGKPSMRHINNKSKSYSFYYNCIHESTPILYNEINYLAINDDHKNYALTNQLNRLYVYPFEFSAGERKGAIFLYLNELTRDLNAFRIFLKKLINLVQFAYKFARQNDNIYNLAYYDTKLQIPNRHGMQHYIQSQYKELSGKKLSVVLLSPSEYIKIVELYGRDMGEIMLQEIIHQINKTVKCNLLFIGRFSSSTLYGIVEGEINMNTFTRLLDETKSEPIILNGRTIYTTMKVGVAIQQYGECLEETCRRAEIALSQARQKNGNRVGVYDQNYIKQIEEENFLLIHLTKAIAQKEIQAYFQPKIELYRGRIDSMEALARWNSPELGFISPAEFIPIAEKNGLIQDIDLIIIEQVLSWMQQSQYNGQNIVPVSVNISADHFYHPLFVETLMDLINKYYADPKSIIIEITETLGLEDIELAYSIITRLRLLGFNVSVDDFGMGYSSLSYLQKLHFCELKIDMSFVKRLDEEGTRAIVRSIIDIAKHLEMRVVAEGIETVEQMETLKALGCDVAQGYLFYKPMPIEALNF